MRENEKLALMMAEAWQDGNRVIGHKCDPSASKNVREKGKNTQIGPQSFFLVERVEETMHCDRANSCRPGTDASFITNVRKTLSPAQANSCSRGLCRVRIILFVWQ